MRVQAAAAYLHHRAGSALRREGISPDLPGYRGRVVKGVIEGTGGHVQAGVGGTRVSGTERVKLLDGAIGIDHYDGAREEAEPLHRAGLAEHQLDKLAEQADARFLPWRGVPAFEDVDQPVRVAGARGR